MPFLRNNTFGYETTTADAGLVIPEATNLNGDLIIALAMCDTGALTTWTATPPAGWNILQDWYNTTPCQAYFRISDGSVTDLTLLATTHATTTETYNGFMACFGDVDTVTPLGVKTSDSNVTQNSNQALGNGTVTAISHSFITLASSANTNARGCFARAKFYLKIGAGSPSGNMVAKIYSHSGVYGTSSVPNALLATSNPINANTLTGSYQEITFAFPSGQWAQFVAATNYCVVLEFTGDASNYVHVAYNSSTVHGGNKATFSGSWAAQAGEDCYFKVEQFTLNFSNQAAAQRLNLPQVTTERDHSILLYILGSSGNATTPSFVEGPLYGMIGGDGAAEGQGAGIVYQKTAGQSPSTYYATCAGHATSFKGVSWINPPTTGPTVYPAYVVSDACQFIDPNQGVGFNSNTALAATADANYGTTIGAFTANDATVAAVVDTGMFSFRSMGGMTNTAVASQVSGADLVIAAANRFNFSSQNLLAHVIPTTLAHSQRMPTVASGRGFWMGVRSNTGSGGATTGWKVWQVHGVDALWEYGRHIPIIINNGAGNTVGTSGTLDPAVITSVGFWNSGISTLTCQLSPTMIWLMDTTVIAGGYASAPLDIKSIVNIIRRKERFSVVSQGAKQMLCLQDLQIGDGGTNPVYLFLDATAIEFPRQYNAATSEVNYNSIDNKVGLKYYGGASDTIVHKNSVISSPSRFFWGLHASHNVSCTPDFSGTSVIGAGTISLARAVTITQLTINDYVTIDATGLTLTYSTIKGAPGANDSITLTSASNIDYCNLIVTGVTAGNRWCSVADPSIFTYCNFTGGGGHAIRITQPGTYTLTGNVFTGFGADGSTGAAIFNDSSGAVTLNISGGVASPTVKNGTNASTTVNNNRTLTLTGLQAGSDINILAAGTINERINVQENAGTTYPYTYSAGDAGVSVDIGVFKAGYIPYYVRSFLLPSSDASLPVAQEIDRAYLI